MPEVIGHTPLLLGLLSNNQNANNGGLVNAGTVVIHKDIAENGYLILLEVLTAAEAAELLREAYGAMKRISEGGEGIKRHDVSGGMKRPSPIGRILATFEPATVVLCSALAFWYALEDATIENGCLCVTGGSHLTAPLRQRLTKEDNGLPKFEDLEVPLWARGAHSSEVDARQTECKYQTLEVKKGTLVLFHGNLTHKSGTNKSEKNRIAYTFSIIEGNVECPDDSYMKPVEGNFKSL
ncbi:MAG: hypothetical protein Q9164_000070 [Protoblastenia rupestris]